MSDPAVRTAAKIVAPSDIDRFACTGCGGCCRLWGISIDEGSFKRTEDFLKSPPEPRPNPDLAWYSEADGKKFYNLTEDGTCVFLQKNNQCYLHRFDPMLKSEVCRDYPRGFVATPRGIELIMSFSSFGAFQSILANPEPFALTEAEGLSTQLPCPKTAVQTPKTFGWDTYFLIESILLDFIGHANSLDDAFIASSKFLDAVEHETDGKDLRRKLRKRTLHPLIFMEHRPVSDVESAYRLVEKILSLRITFLKLSPELRAAEKSTQDFLDALVQGPAEEQVGRALFCRRMRRSYYDPASPALFSAIRKFMQYKIFQKTFFLEFGFVLGFNILMFLYAVLRLRLMTRARRDRRPPVLADLFDPIHFVEIQFTHSGKFLSFWKEVFRSNILTSPALSEIMVRL